jgi:hypothetical protein
VIPISFGIVPILYPKHSNAACDAKTSKIRKPSSVCAATWTRRPSKGSSDIDRDTAKTVLEAARRAQ